ncbi:MAG: [protein-PII] uridylyltransferase [Gammaproteobacteria bacterium]|nr:[protein-PII] uridylyltransferase [Gammaproteobacteria bacterium]
MSENALLNQSDDSLLDELNSSDNNEISILKDKLKQLETEQDTQFDNQANIIHLIHERSHAIDSILQHLWRYFKLENYDICLVAVGGYGRGELHPKSDIDILILHEHSDDLDDSESKVFNLVQDFIRLLWDIGLNIGQSVRTVKECVDEAEKDISTISNLMESRQLIGQITLYNDLKSAIEPSKIWPTAEFVNAKMKEQHLRHQKFNDTAYNLEPNIKEGPGGLRDIQMIAWIAKRHFDAETLKDLVSFHFLTPEEYIQLEKGQSFLWKIRYALHRFRNRPEERLLFDHQRILAEKFNYKDNDEQLSVEQFMADYYQNIMELDRLNEILLQYFREMILYNDKTEARPKKINNRFVIYKNYISTINDKVFIRYPFALLEIFLILAENPSIKGIRASTIREIRAHHYLIDNTFRQDLRCRSIFIELLRQKRGITAQLRRMNRYGVLAEYIPPFKQIVGQMQHDLYHAYTVDEHTLRVLRNVRRLSVEKHFHEMPLASKIFAKIPKPELLYLAAIFHDIGKGRGGDHSQLGAEDAEAFCQLHDMSPTDIRVVTWLVRSHLKMSMVAQRKDLGDPQVVHDFALYVKDLVHLDYIYVLTVSDIRATSPKVWSTWKDSLLMELYNLTKKALLKGLESPIDQFEKINHTKIMANEILQKSGLTIDLYHGLWEQLPKDYFMQNSEQTISWHTDLILKKPDNSGPLVAIRPDENRGSTEVLIFMREKSHVFALVTSVIAKLMASVTEAKTYRTNNGCLLHSYHILDEQDKAITDTHFIQKLTQQLTQALSEDNYQIPQSTRNIPRTLKQFTIPTEIKFSEDLENNWTIMYISTTNRPFLLSKIGQTLIQHDIHLVNARISTFGEKVEDVFYISDMANHLITDFSLLRKLEIALIDTLDVE